MSLLAEELRAKAEEECRLRQLVGELEVERRLAEEERLAAARPADRHPAAGSTAGPPTPAEGGAGNTSTPHSVIIACRIPTSPEAPALPLGG